MARIGIYLGDITDPASNISASLEPWTRYLTTGGHQVDLFGGAVPFKPAHPKCDQLQISGSRPSSSVTKGIVGFDTCMKYCQKYSPDIIVQFWRYPHHAPAVALAGSLTRTPTVLRFNGDILNQHRMYDGFLRYPVAGFQWFSGFIANLADRVIAFGSYGKNELKKCGVSSQKINILPPSADIGDRFQPAPDVSTVRKELSISLNKKIVLYVGRIESSKGMEFLQKVIESSYGKGNTKFLLVGPGAGESEVVDHDTAREFDNDIVRIEGKVSHSKIHKYYQSSDVYVHPSPFEGIPLTLIEALKCGLPVVARPAGDISLLTSNLASDPDQMAKIVYNNSWDKTWENKELFSKDYQYSKINSIISDIID